MKRKQYQSVYFAQGENSDDLLEYLDEKGPTETIDLILEFVDPDHADPDLTDGSAAGTSDHTHKTRDGFILSWNERIGYIGLERQVKVD